MVKKTCGEKHYYIRSNFPNEQCGHRQEIINANTAEQSNNRGQNAMPFERYLPYAIYNPCVSQKQVRSLYGQNSHSQTFSVNLFV